MLPHITGPSSANGDGRLSLHPPTLAGQHWMHLNCHDLLFWTDEQSSIQAGPLLFDDRAMTEHNGFGLCAAMAPCNIPRPEPPGPSTPTPGPRWALPPSSPCGVDPRPEETPRLGVAAGDVGLSYTVRQVEAAMSGVSRSDPICPSSPRTRQQKCPASHSLLLTPVVYLAAS